MTVNDLSAEIKCSGNPVGLGFYSAYQVNKGVSVKVFKAGSRDIVRHAFVAKMKSGHLEFIGENITFGVKRGKLEKERSGIFSDY